MSKRTSCKYLQVHIGEELESKLKAPNNYSSYAIMVLAKEKSKTSKWKTSKKSDKEWITVGHVPDTFVEILFPVMKTCQTYSTKAILSENHPAAPEGI